MENNITVKKVLFKNPLNFSTVFLTNDNETCTGYFPVIYEGLTIKAKYTSSINSRYNKKQLQIKQYEVLPPSSLDELLSFLKEPFIMTNPKNNYTIDPITPVLIINKIGLDYVRLYWNIKELLLLADSATLKEATKQLQQYKTNINSFIRFLRKYNFLIQYGLESDVASLIASSEYRLLESEFVKNPYDVLKYFDLSWVLIDRVALKNNIKNDSPVRKRAAVVYGILKAIKEHAHICGNTLEIFESIHKELYYNLSKNDYDSVLKGLVDDNEVRIDDKRNIYLAFHFEAEESLAYNIIRLGRSKDHSEILKRKASFDDYISSLSDEINYSESQIRAIESSGTHNLNLLLGPAGAGKTTTLKGIINFFEHYEKKEFGEEKINGEFEKFFEQNILLLAPTNLAKERMQHSTGRQAHTIHSILGLSDIYVTSTFNEENQLPHKYVFVDEFSMADTILTSRLLAAISNDCTLVLIGDDNQLPSIGPGRVLNEMKQLEEVNLLLLTEIFRQGADSNIIGLSQYIIHEDTEKIKELLSEKRKDLLSIHSRDSFIIRDYITTLYKQILQKDNFDIYTDFQIIVPMNIGPIGVVKINEAIQKIHLEKNNIKPSDKKFYLYDKVMQTKNDTIKKVFNGEMGKVINTLGTSITVKFNSGKVIQYTKNEASFNLELCFATTIHKMQGSESKVIMLIVHHSFTRMLNKNLLYTGCTRAKQHLILLGDMNALLDGSRRNDFINRRSRIAEQIEINMISALLK